MTKEQATHLSILLGNGQLDALLNEYSNVRIEELKNHLVTASLDDIKFLQGQIAEIKRLKTLRDELKKGRESKS